MSTSQETKYGLKSTQKDVVAPPHIHISRRCKRRIVQSYAVIMCSQSLRRFIGDEGTC
jgi:hypothetical protein